ncbi:MAG: hypothetical protein KDD05_01975 [Psychroserpens sp.]|nr:hypothetical protein [Psychroserpens sp.]
MKTSKFLKLLSLCLLIGFSSCSKDDGDDNNDDFNGEITVANLIGSWRLIKEIDRAEGYPDDVYNVPEGCNELVFVITANEITSKSDYDCDGTFDDTTTSSYTLSGNFILDSSGGEGVKIQTLTNTTLKLRFDIIEENVEYYELVFTKLN